MRGIIPTLILILAAFTPTVSHANALSSAIEICKKYSPIGTMLDEVQNILDRMPVFSSQASASNDFYTPVCRSFIDEYGVLGEHGNIIKNELLKENSHLKELLDKEVLAGVKDIEKVCPRINEFSEIELVNFWIWTFMAIANKESSCNPKIGYGPLNDDGFYPVGLLQMEKVGERLDGTRSRWAGNPEPRKACRSRNLISDAGDNIRCGLDAMKNLIMGYHSCAMIEVPGSTPTINREKTPNCQGEIFANSYWQKMRCTDTIQNENAICKNDGDAIIRGMMKIPFCRRLI